MRIICPLIIYFVSNCSRCWHWLFLVKGCVIRRMFLCMWSLRKVNEILFFLLRKVIVFYFKYLNMKIRIAEEEKKKEMFSLNLQILENVWIMFLINKLRNNKFIEIEWILECFYEKSYLIVSWQWLMSN